jgi:drug/metabolite transporter (DMT)-like permease
MLAGRQSGPQRNRPDCITRGQSGRLVCSLIRASLKRLDGWASWRLCRRFVRSPLMCRQACRKSPLRAALQQGLHADSLRRFIDQTCHNQASRHLSSNLIMSPHHSLFASLSLLLVTLLWGTTFPAMKAVSEVMPAGLMVGVRWGLAALALAPFIAWRDRRLWRDAALLGVPLFASFVLQVLGLTMMSAGRNAFITGLNVIMVPLLLAALGARLIPISDRQDNLSPSPCRASALTAARLRFSLLSGNGMSQRAVLAAGLASIGIVVMSYEQSSGFLGDLLTFGCALAFAIYVIGMERYAPRHSARSLAGAQAVVMTALCQLWMGAEWFFWGDAYPAMAAKALTVWPQLLYLGLVCSAFALILQTWAQARASAVQAAVIYALEPFFAAVFAAWWLGEIFGVRGVCGGALVIIAMLISQWPQRNQSGSGHPHAPN